MKNYLVLKPLHKDVGGHSAGAEVKLGPGMAHSLLMGGYVCEVGGATYKKAIAERADLPNKLATAQALSNKARK